MRFNFLRNVCEIISSCYHYLYYKPPRQTSSETSFLTFFKKKVQLVMLQRNRKTLLKVTFLPKPETPYQRR